MPEPGPSDAPRSARPELPGRRDSGDSPAAGSRRRTDRLFRQSRRPSSPFRSRIAQLTLTADHLVDVAPRVFPDPAADAAVGRRPSICCGPIAVPRCLSASQFVFDSRYVERAPRLADYAGASFAARPADAGRRPRPDAAHSRDFEYDPEATTVATPLDEVFAQRRGVCQDFAHLEIACLRSLGLAARYVSGYLRTDPPPGHVPLVGADATHAWLSVYCPGPGWVDVDPTNNQIPGDAYILLAWGRDYDDVSPVKGVILGGGRHSVRVAVNVDPVTDAEVQRSLNQTGSADAASD